MLTGFVGGLITAWFLTLFHVEVILIDAIQPFVSIELNVSMYYVLFAILGMVGEIFGNGNKTIKVEVEKED